MNTTTRKNGMRQLTVDDSIRPLSGEELDLVSGGDNVRLAPIIRMTVLTLMGSNSGLGPAPALGGPTGGSGSGSGAGSGGCGPNGGGSKN